MIRIPGDFPFPIGRFQALLSVGRFRPEISLLFLAVVRLLLEIFPIRPDSFEARLEPFSVRPIIIHSKQNFS